jgi:ribosomal-protein-alanine N-acetyltransferase
MQSTIRPAQAADSDHLRRLQSLLAEPAPSLLSAAMPSDTVTDHTATDHATGDPDVSLSTTTFTLLVTVDEQDLPVGYLLALHGEETHIAELVVDPDSRRAGRGRTLLETVVDRSSGPLTVHVAADNDAARRLYETVGFTEIARSADRFEHDDAITLRYDPQ